VLGINAKRYLPSAILKVKNASRDKTYVATPLLKRPSKHNNPTIILIPPYKPATSEYPISPETFKPIASINEGIS
tara:strand:+ start:2960 stop:3184 length:225 start_codon:yes stop_codon:yes gene_type:complete